MDCDLLANFRLGSSIRIVTHNNIMYLKFGLAEITLKIEDRNQNVQMLFSMRYQRPYVHLVISISPTIYQSIWR